MHLNKAYSFQVPFFVGFLSRYVVLVEFLRLIKGSSDQNLGFWVLKAAGEKNKVFLELKSYLYPIKYDVPRDTMGPMASNISLFLSEY